jgi:hypothetical protein
MKKTIFLIGVPSAVHRLTAIVYQATGTCARFAKISGRRDADDSSDHHVRFIDPTT